MRELTWISKKELELLNLLAARKLGKENSQGWAQSVPGDESSQLVLCNVCGEIFNGQTEMCLMSSLDDSTRNCRTQVFVGSIEHGRKHLEESKLLGWM